jgi:hypothetical protein
VQLLQKILFIFSLSIITYLIAIFWSPEIVFKHFKKQGYPILLNIFLLVPLNIIGVIIAGPILTPFIVYNKYYAKT